MSDPAFSGGPWGTSLVLRVLPASTTDFDELHSSIVPPAASSTTSTPIVTASSPTTASESLPTSEAKIEQQEEVPASILLPALSALPLVQDPVLVKQQQEKKAAEEKRATKLADCKKAENEARQKVDEANKKVEEAQQSGNSPPLLIEALTAKARAEGQALQAAKLLWALEQDVATNEMDTSTVPRMRPATTAVLTLPFPPPARTTSKPQSNMKELAVVHYTPLGDEIDPHNTTIVIRFNHSVLAAASEDELKTETTEGMVDISPNVEGEWRWMSADTLEFRPRGRFLYSTQYSVCVNNSKLATPNGLKLLENFSFSFITSFLQLSNFQEIQNTTLSAHNRRPTFSLCFNQTVDLEHMRENVYLVYIGAKEKIECTLSESYVLQPIHPLHFHFPIALRIAAGTKGIEGNVGLPVKRDTLLSVQSLIFHQLLPLSDSSPNFTLGFSQPLGDPGSSAFVSNNPMIEPCVEGEWKVNEQKCERAQFFPSQPLSPGRYTITLPKELCSSLGVPLAPGRKLEQAIVPFPSIIDSHAPLFRAETGNYLLADQPIVSLLFSRPMARESLKFIKVTSCPRNLEGKSVMKALASVIDQGAKPVALTWLTDEDEQSLVVAQHPASFPSRKTPSTFFHAFRPTNLLSPDHVLSVSYECPGNSNQANFLTFYTYPDLDIHLDGPNNDHPQSLNIKFNHPMLMGSFPDDCKVDPFGIQLAADGSWQWKDATNLSFNFTTQPEWPSYFALKFPTPIQSLVEGRAKPAFNTTVSTEIPRLLKYWPRAYAHELQPFILLHFSRPLAINQLATMFTLQNSKGDAFGLTIVAQPPEVCAEFTVQQADILISNPQHCVLLKPNQPLRRGGQYKVMAQTNVALFEFKSPAESFDMEVSAASWEPLRVRINFTVPPATRDLPTLSSSGGSLPPGEWKWENQSTLEYVSSDALLYPNQLLCQPVKGLQSTFGDDLNFETIKVQMTLPQLLNWFIPNSTRGSKVSVLQTRPILLLNFSRAIAPALVLPLLSCELVKVMHLGSKAVQLQLVEGDEAYAVWKAARGSEAKDILQGLTPQSDLRWMAVRPVEDLTRDSTYAFSMQGNIVDLRVYVVKPLAVTMHHFPTRLDIVFTHPMVLESDSGYGSILRKDLGAVDTKGITIDPPPLDTFWQWIDSFTLQCLPKPNYGFAIGTSYLVTVPKGTCSLMDSKLEHDETRVFAEEFRLPPPLRPLPGCKYPLLVFQCSRLVNPAGVLSCLQAKMNKKNVPLQLALGDDDEKQLMSMLTELRFPHVIADLIVSYNNLLTDALEGEHQLRTYVPQFHVALRVLIPEENEHSEITIEAAERLQFKYSFVPQPLVAVKFTENPLQLHLNPWPHIREEICTGPRLTPAVAGRWKWKWNCLEFEPQTHLPFATNFTLSFPADYCFEVGTVGSNPTRFEFSTPAPKVLWSTISQGTFDEKVKKWTKVAPNAFVIVMFNQPADFETVRKFIQVTAGTMQLEATALNSEQNTLAKELILNARANPKEKLFYDLGASAVCFAFKQRLPRGSTVEITFTNLVLKEGPIPMPTPWTLSFGVLPFLQLLPFSTHPEPRASWDLQFSGPIARTLPENAVKISPALQFMDLEVDPMDNNILVIRNTSKPTTSYSVSLTGLLDQFGDQVADGVIQVKTGTAAPMSSPTITMPEGTGGTKVILLAPQGDLFLPITSVNCVQFAVEVFQTTATIKNIESFLVNGQTSGQVSKLSVGVDVQGPHEQTVTNLAVGSYLKGIGHLIVRARPMAGKKQAGPAVSVWIQASELSLQTFMGPSELLVWVMRSGKPAVGANVEFGSARGATDATGVCVIAVTEGTKSSRVRATLGEDSVFSAELFPLPESDRVALRTPTLAWFVFDDRKLYQPAEKVHAKGIVRWVSVDEKTAGNPALPSLVDGRLEYKVVDGNSREITRGVVANLALGSFDLEFDLPAQCNTGVGSIEFTLTPDTLPPGLVIGKAKVSQKEEKEQKQPSWSNTRSFQIQTFRRPEFLVKIKRAGPDPLVADIASVNRVILQLQATYLAGGAMPDATVKWQVQARTAHFAPSGWPTFTFGNGSDPGDVHILRLDGMCDDTGTHALQVQFKGQESHCSPLQIRAKAEVIDATQLKAEDDVSFMIHPCAHYIGASLPAVKPIPNVKWPVLALVCDTNGHLVSGEVVFVHIKSTRPGRDQRGRIVLDEREFSARISADRPTTVEVEFAIGGPYIITLSTCSILGSANEEKKANEVIGASPCILNVNVEGGFEPRNPADGVVRVPLLPQDQLIVDVVQKEFEAGEIVRVKVQCPFAQGIGLVLLSSNGRVGTPSPFSITNGEGEATFTVQSEWAPNVRALFQVVGTQTLPTARPAYASGYVDIRVSLASKTLAIKLNPTGEAEVGVPGGSVTTTVCVMEPHSTRPVAGANVCIVLVDEAILSLTNYRLSNPVYTFFPPRALQLLKLSSTWSDVLLLQKPKPISEWGPEERRQWLNSAILAEQKRKLFEQAQWEESKKGLLVMKARNKNIDTLINQFHSKDSMVSKIVLLGMPDSGKNSLLTQLEVVYGKGLSEETRMSYWPLVRLGLAEDLRNMPPEADSEVDRFALVASITDNADTCLLPQDYKQCLRITNPTGYFLSNLTQVFGPDAHVPSEQSCVRVKLPVTHVRSFSFEIDGNSFEVCTPNQKNERRKWIHIFEGVTAIIYMVNLMYVWEKTEEDWKDYLQDFAALVGHHLFQSTSIILFLNRRDGFAERLRKQPLPAHFKFPNASYEACVDFIGSLFLAGSNDNYRSIYTHVTAVTDPGNTQAVFDAVKDIVIRRSLACAGLCGGGGGGGDFFSSSSSSSPPPGGASVSESAVSASSEPLKTSRPAQKPASPAPSSSSSPTMAVARERSNFNPLACWAASLVTDEKGCASVVVKLPDSTTRYRCYAVAATPSLFGLQEASLAVQLPLTLRPTAPRFLNFGDEAGVVIVVQNLTSVRVEAWVGLRVMNASVHLPQQKGENGTNATSIKMSIPPNGRGSASFVLSDIVLPSAPVLLQCFALAPSFSDAVLLRVPVRPPATSQAFALQGEVEGDSEGSIEIPIKVPDPKVVFPAVGCLRFSLAVTQLQGLIQAAVYLFTFEFDNTEQLSARIVGLLALAPVLSQFHSPLLPTESELFETLSKNVSVICARQHSAASLLKKADSDPGAIGCWTKGGYVSVIGCLQAALALVFYVKTYPKTQKTVLKTLIPLMNWLETLSSFGETFKEIRDWGRRARLSVLALACYVRGAVAAQVREKTWVPRPILADLEQLAAVEPQEWAIEGAAWLCSALHAAGQPALAKRHLEFVLNGIDVTKNAIRWKQNQPYSTHPGVSHYLMLWSEARSEAVVLDCLLQCSPVHIIVPSLARALLARRERGRWANTQENVWSILALYRFAHLREETAPKLEAQAWIDEKFVGSTRFETRTLLTKQCELPMAEITREVADGAKHRTLLIHKQGMGTLFYSVSLNYAGRNLSLAPVPGGVFVLKRSYEHDPSQGGTADDVQLDAAGVWRIKVGAPVIATVAISTSAVHSDVAFVDCLPAGLEPILALSTFPSNDKANSWFEHRNVRDDSVEVFASVLPAGEYKFRNFLRAMSLGRFIVPPVRAEEQYHSDEMFGSSKSDVLRVV